MAIGMTGDDLGHLHAPCGGLGDLGLGYGIRSSLPMLLGEVAEPVLERLPEWTEDSFAGILLNVAAGRVANRFDLGGVNYTVDAACASSLAAVDLAAARTRCVEPLDMGLVQARFAEMGGPCHYGLDVREALAAETGLSVADAITVGDLHRKFWPERPLDSIIYEHYAVCTLEPSATARA